MRNFSTVCVDASLVVRLHDPGQVEHARVVELWEEWAIARVELIAPFLLRYEVTNAAYRFVRSGAFTEMTGQLLVASLQDLPIRYVDTYEMHLSAFEFARRFDVKTSYDGHYIALAEREGVPLVTADRKLVNTARFHYSFVRHVMDDENAGPSRPGVLRGK